VDEASPVAKLLTIRWPEACHDGRHYSIGRASLNGTGINQRFIAVPHGPSGVAGLAVSSRYIYWTDEEGNEIGRASLNGTGVNQRFITGASFPDAIAAGSRYLYWTNQNSRAIGRARLNGTGINQRFVTGKDFRNLHGIAIDLCP
jgi:virginiamycin B lyase